MAFGKGTVAGAAFAFALLAADGALAGKTGKGNPHDDEGISGGGGAQAAIDAHGKLRAPTREESELLLQQMARYLDQSSVGLTVKVLSNGTRVVDLQDRFQDVAIARIVDGRAEWACVDTIGEAREFLLREPLATSRTPVSRVPQRVAAPLEEQ